MSLSDSLQAVLNVIQERADSIRSDVNTYVDDTNELFYSRDPNSERSQILEEIVKSDDAKDLAINLIARDQLLERQITPWGAPTPTYKPRTIRYKTQRGFPDKWKIRYTEYDTGRFYNNGINIFVDRGAMEYWMGIWNVNEFPYFEFIPEEYIDFTPENRDYFEMRVGEMLRGRLVDEWLRRESVY